MQPSRSARWRAWYWGALERRNIWLHDLRIWAKPWTLAAQQRRNEGLFALRIDAKVGFFAQLSWCLIALGYCRSRGLRPLLMLTGALYASKRGEDWLGTYFDQPAITPEDRARLEKGTVRFSTVSDIGQARLRGVPKLTLEEAHALMAQHLVPRPEITEHVEAFVRQRFGGRRVLGLHYRGTDKHTEAEPVTWERCREVVLHYLQRHPEIEVVFVASDEQPFVDWISTRLGAVEVLSHADESRSSGADAVHIDPLQGDNARKGWDALVNCLLLARCDVLVRTASFLSSWSLVFNPKLPVVVLNRPHANKLWFPDDAVGERSMNEYLQVPATGASRSGGAP